MPVKKYSQEEVESVLHKLAANNNDIARTSDETGIEIDAIYAFKKRALQKLDIIRVKQGKEVIDAGHKFILTLLKSNDLKGKVKDSSLKEVTDFIVKILDKIKEYQEILGFVAVDAEEAMERIPPPGGLTRKAEEDELRLIPKDGEEKEVRSIGVNTDNIFNREDKQTNN